MSYALVTSRLRQGACPPFPGWHKTKGLKKKKKMEMCELQLGDYVSCRDSICRIHTLRYVYDKSHPIGVTSEESMVLFFAAEDVKPIQLTAEVLLKNGFSQDTIGSGLIKHIDGAENRYILVNFRYNGECRNVEVSNGMFNLSRPVRYVHELQQSLRLVRLSVLADDFKL